MHSAASLGSWEIEHRTPVDRVDCLILRERITHAYRCRTKITHRGEVRLVNVDGIVRLHQILDQTRQLDYSLDVSFVTLNLRQQSYY